MGRCRFAKPSMSQKLRSSFTTMMLDSVERLSLPMLSLMKGSNWKERQFFCEKTKI